MTTYNILIMGASYGSLLASKLLFGGHRIKLVCLPAEADAINSDGIRVRKNVDGIDPSIKFSTNPVNCRRDTIDFRYQRINFEGIEVMRG